MSRHYEFVSEVGSRYLASATKADVKKVAFWKPTQFAWPYLRDSQHFLLGMQKRSMEIDGDRFVWIEGGNPRGEKVVLLHGFGASKENWLTVIPLLRKNYRIYAPDLPAWGESHYGHGKLYGIDQQVERVSLWMSRFKDSPVHLVGSSMGGTISALVAARHSQCVSTLTLMNAAGVRGKKTSRFEQGLLNGKNALVAHNFSDVVKLFMWVTHRNRRVLAAGLAPVLAPMITGRRDINHYLFQQLMSAPPAEDLLGYSDIKVPTLLFWGDRDEVIDASCIDTFSELIPHADKKILSGIGHLPMLEAPRLTVRHLQRFWSAGKSVCCDDVEVNPA